MLRKTYQRTERKGTESFPITMRSLWRLVKESVLTENCRVKEQLKEAIRILEDVQDRIPGIMQRRSRGRGAEGA